jgi:hypothetical protein
VLKEGEQASEEMGLAYSLQEKERPNEARDHTKFTQPQMNSDGICKLWLFISKNVASEEKKTSWTLFCVEVKDLSMDASSVCAVALAITPSRKSVKDGKELVLHGPFCLE